MNNSFEKEQPQPEPQPLPLRLFFALAMGTLAMALGAVIWGLVGYFSDKAYMFIAMAIGMAVAAAVLLPLRPIQKRTALVFLPIILVATLLSVLLGEMLYVVLFLMRDYQAGLGEAVAAALDSLGMILLSSDSVMSAILGLIGALAGFFSVWQRL